MTVSYHSVATVRYRFRDGQYDIEYSIPIRKRILYNIVGKGNRTILLPQGIDPNGPLARFLFERPPVWDDPLSGIFFTRVRKPPT